MKERFCASFGMVRRLAVQYFVQSKLGQGEGGFDRLRKRRRAARADIAIRIMFGRQKQKAHRPVIAGVRQTRFERAPRGAPSGFIAVEAKDDVISVSEQFLHREGGACRAERGHCGWKPQLRKRKRIERAYDDQRVTMLTNGRARFQKTAESPAFVKQRRFGRVEIFG